MSDQATIPPFRLELTSGPMAVREMLGLVLDRLAPLRLSVDQAGTVELVLAETLNNIVEHAYPDSTAPGPIRLSCAAASGYLLIEIEDEGREMPGGVLPDGAPAAVDVDLMALPEGGFGWFLIRDLAENLRYERVGGRNRLCLSIAADCGEAGRAAGQV